MNYQLHKDEDLLHLLSHSDSKAFNEIYRRYWIVVFRYAVGKVHTQQVAEDLCQDVFVSLWQRRNVLSIQNLEAYLVQATKYGVLNYVRLKIQNKKQFTLAMPNYTANETEDTAALHNLMSAWEKAIYRLPAKTQQVFRLSKVEDYSNKEIAKELHLTEKAVEYHITKSYKIIRLQLREFIVLAVTFILMK